ncbi:MAG: transposase [Nannocystaceae bacterium]|nr:transposase [Nannocystaceae bacterium]
MAKKTPTRRGKGDPAQFREDAVKLALAPGASVADVADRLGISDKSLYGWIRIASTGRGAGAYAIQEENAALKAEVKRLRQERVRRRD